MECKIRHFHVAMSVVDQYEVRDMKHFFMSDHCGTYRNPRS